MQRCRPHKRGSSGDTSSAAAAASGGANVRAGQSAIRRTGALPTEQFNAIPLSRAVELRRAPINRPGRDGSLRNQTAFPGEPRAPRPPSPPVSSSSSATLSLFSIGQGARRAAPLHTAHMRRTSLRKCTPAAATQPRLNWPVLSLPEAQHLTRAGFAFSWWYGRCAARVDAARALGPHAGCSTA